MYLYIVNVFKYLFYPRLKKVIYKRLIYLLPRSSSLTMFLQNNCINHGVTNALRRYDTVAVRIVLRTFS